MFELLVIAAIVALFLQGRRRAARFEARLAAAEAEILRLRGTEVVVPGPRPAPVVDTPVEVPPAPPSAVPVPTAPVPSVPRTRPAGPSLEERIGARWPVWIGGVALALGGMFLVRYSIEQDLIGPGTRAAMGGLFALALAGAGEAMRRRERPVAFAAFPSANVPAVLTAAGTLTAFATAFAAYALYGLIEPATAFVLLGAVALGTMVLAALHGPSLAALGLLGALGAPLLVAGGDPNMAALVVYLGFVVAAADGLARLRLWRWLALSALAGAILWGVLIVIVSVLATPAMAHSLVQTALAVGFLAVAPYRGMPAKLQRVDRWAIGWAVALALLAALVASDTGLGSARPLIAAATVALLLGGAVASPAASWIAAAAALAAIGVLGLWPVAGEAAGEPVTVFGGWEGGAPRPQPIETFLATASILAAMLAGAGLARTARTPRLPTGTAAGYLTAAVAGPLAILAVAYLRVAWLDASLPFALAAGALGLAFSGVARWFRARETGEDGPAIRLAVGVAASGAIGALALGLTFALDRGSLTVALALSALGAAWVADRTAVPALRYAIAALAILVAARLAWDPTVVGRDVGATPIFNWLLWGYGLPALAFWGAARLLARMKRDARTARDRVVLLCETLAILLAAIWVFLEIRHALHDGDPFAPGSGLLEAGLLVTEGLAFTLLLARMERRRPGLLYRSLSLAFATASLVGAFVSLGIDANPLFTDEPVRGPVLLGTLAPAYLLPALLAAAIAWASRRTRPTWFVLAAAGLALALQSGWAALEIRHAFQGPRIGAMRWTGDAEFWSYSLLLLAEGAALLAAGFVWRRRSARLVSAGFIVAAIVKVFVVDLANLGGLVRALSFVGLGLALVAIGLAYQRLVAPRTRE